jgi:hypothetical protein
MSAGKKEMQIISKLNNRKTKKGLNGHRVNDKNARDRERTKLSQLVSVWLDNSGLQNVSRQKRTAIKGLQRH